MTFQPENYGPAVAKILGDGQRLMPLGPGQPISEKRDLLKEFNPDNDLGIVHNPAAALACWAGLWLYWDFLDEAHAIAQDLHTPEGSAWHAIVHRREPDAWNSKYWWRQVGQVEWFSKVEYSSAIAFVDECERVRGSGGDNEKNARRVQSGEWQALFDHCYWLAITDSKRSIR